MKTIKTQSKLTRTIQVQHPDDWYLIAAAPDLLHALKKAHFALESLYHMGKGNRELLPYIRLNQAAIKKAEGK